MGAAVFFESTNELAVLTNTFTVGGTPTDPTAVSLTITDPDQASTTYTYSLGEITRTGAGVYTKNIPCATAGTWTYLWEGTVDASDAVAGTWTVHETVVGRLYCTVETLKSRLRITNTEHDRELLDACFTAARSVELFCDRHFWRTASTARTFQPRDLYCLKLPEFNDLVSVTTLKTDASGDGTFETTWASTDYQLLPQNPSAAPEQKPYTEIRAVGTRTFPVIYSPVVAARLDRIEITGVWGWPAVPWGVKTGTALLAQELFKSKEATGGAITTEFGVVRLRQSALMTETLSPYSRHPHGPKGKIMVA